MEEQLYDEFLRILYNSYILHFYIIIIYMNKKKVIIWANCQSCIAKYIFDKYLNDYFDTEVYINYEFMRNKSDLPDDFKYCDIFLFQNYKKKENDDAKYDLDFIKNNILKKDCITLCFPTLHSNLLYFCYDTENIKERKKNCDIIEKEHPDSKKNIYFSISIIQDLYEKHKNTKKYISNDEFENIIIQDFLDYNINEDDILKYNKKSFDFLKLKILNSDIPELYDFIIDNWKTQKLWYNPNHPTGVLYMKMAELIFKKLNINIILTNDDFNTYNSIHRDYEMPILPSVKKYYNLNFKDICHIRGLSQDNYVYDTKTYIKQYLKCFN